MFSLTMTVYICNRRICFIAKWAFESFWAIRCNELIPLKPAGSRSSFGFQSFSCGYRICASDNRGGVCQPWHWLTGMFIFTMKVYIRHCRVCFIAKWALESFTTVTSSSSSSAPFFKRSLSLMIFFFIRFHFHLLFGFGSNL
jgi:hypothetical protein